MLRDRIGSCYSGLDVATLWSIQARHRRDHLFVVWEPFEGARRSWSYGEFHEAIQRVATGLRNRGVAPGQRLLIHLDNSPEWMLSWFACAEIGAVAVTTNTRCAVDEMQYFIEHSRAVGAITQPRYASTVNAAGPGLSFVACTETDAGAAPTTGSGPGFADSFDRLLAPEPYAVSRPADAAALFSVQYTSGTTARPKGVMWTHANALWGGQVGAAHESLTSDDVHLLTLPLFHANAQAYSLLPALWAGATIILQPRFSASRFWDTAVRNGCTWASIVGFCLRALKVQPVPSEHRFRLWGCAFSEPRSDARFGVKTIGWWGMTETVTHGIVGSPHLPNRPMSIGRQAPEYGLAIVDDAGAPVRDGDVGRLLVAGVPGVSLFAGYLDDATTTAAVLDDRGWLDTGDLVRRGPDGWIDFVDRAKDMLKVGGENVAAYEIERVVGSVAGVGAAAVVGVPHPMLDEVPVVFIVADGSVDRTLLTRHVTDECEIRLADFKRPRHVEFVDSLPESTLGKIAKGRLRELAAMRATTPKPGGEP